MKTITVGVTEISCDGCQTRWTPPDNTDWNCPTCQVSNRFGSRELGRCPSCDREVLGVRTCWKWRPLCNCLSGRPPIQAVSHLHYRFVTEYLHPWSKAVCESNQRPTQLDSFYADTAWEPLTKCQRLYVLGLDGPEENHRLFSTWHEDTLLSDRSCPTDYWWPKCKAILARTRADGVNLNGVYRECLNYLDREWTPKDLVAALKIASAALYRATLNAEKGGAEVLSPTALVMRVFHNQMNEMAGVPSVPPTPPAQLPQRPRVGTRPHSSFEELPLEGELTHRKGA